jgi:ribosomal protein S18 acetylase RimI-like enzyme
MDESEYSAYLEPSIAEYAEDKVKAGNYEPETALERSRAEFNQLLPQGVKTPHHLLYMLLADGQPEPVGMIWVRQSTERIRPIWFILDFIVYEAYRRKGYGRQALAALKERAGEAGIAEIGLHVFAHNQGALSLYQQVGFEITNINMSLKIQA